MDGHNLHEFELGDARFGAPEPDRDANDEASAKLSRLAAPRGRFRYTYDFGDDWCHDITVEKVLAPEPGMRYPACRAGRRACPPEDIGGPWAYAEFLAALEDPKHPTTGTGPTGSGGASIPKASTCPPPTPSSPAVPGAMGDRYLQGVNEHRDI